MESQSQSGRALAYKLGGFESTASLRIAYPRGLLSDRDKTLF